MAWGDVSGASHRGAPRGGRAQKQPDLARSSHLSRTAPRFSVRRRVATKHHPRGKSEAGEKTRHSPAAERAASKPPSQLAGCLENCQQAAGRMPTSSREVSGESSRRSPTVDLAGANPLHSNSPICSIPKLHSPGGSKPGGNARRSKRCHA